MPRTAYRGDPRANPFLYASAEKLTYEEAVDIAYHDAVLSKIRARLLSGSLEASRASPAA